MSDKEPTINVDSVGAATVAAFEEGMRRVGPHEVDSMASTLGVRCLAFLRAAHGEPFVRDYLQAALAELDRPAQILVRTPHSKH